MIKHLLVNAIVAIMFTAMVVLFALMPDIMALR
jgi:hypothetical protein